MLDCLSGSRPFRDCSSSWPAARRCGRIFIRRTGYVGRPRRRRSQVQLPAKIRDRSRRIRRPTWTNPASCRGWVWFRRTATRPQGVEQVFERFRRCPVVRSCFFPHWPVSLCGTWPAVPARSASKRFRNGITLEVRTRSEMPSSIAWMPLSFPVPHGCTPVGPYARYHRAARSVRTRGGSLFTPSAAPALRRPDLRASTREGGQAWRQRGPACGPLFENDCWKVTTRPDRSERRAARTIDLSEGVL